MAKGDLYASESRSWTDSRTGVRIRQITSHRSVSHHPFFLIPAYDDAMSLLVFVSHRDGSPNVFVEFRETGELRQLTDRDDLVEWSVSPSRDGRYVYFTAGHGAWRVNAETLEEEQLLDFGTSDFREEGMVGAAMGTTAVSYDNRWWAVPVKIGETVSRLAIIDTATGKSEIILEADSIGHPEFHPGDSSVLHYAGPYHSRIWVVNRDGSKHRLVYERDGACKQWVVHEAWLPNTRELTVVDWPSGMFTVDVDSGVTRRICSFNTWHAISNRQGNMVVADTTYPDIGLQVFDPNDGKGTNYALCYPEASNVGAHWNTDRCPYDDGPITRYAPQHTHPHPSFSPDGRYVVYTSDNTGFSQVYEVDVHSLKVLGKRRD